MSSTNTFPKFFAPEDTAAALLTFIILHSVNELVRIRNRCLPVIVAVEITTKNGIRNSMEMTISQRRISILKITIKVRLVIKVVVKMRQSLRLF